MKIQELTNLLDYQKLGQRMLLVDVPKPNYKYINGVKSEEISAFTYTIVLEDYGYEKILVKVEGNTPLFKEEDLQGKKAIPVTIKDLQLTPYVRDNQFNFNFKASSISVTK